MTHAPNRYREVAIVNAREVGLRAKRRGGVAFGGGGAHLGGDVGGVGGRDKADAGEAGIGGGLRQLVDALVLVVGGVRRGLFESPDNAAIRLLTVLWYFLVHLIRE